MRKFIAPKSLKSKIILYFLVITIVPSVIISYFYYKVSQYTIEKNMIGTSESNLIYSRDIIDKQIKQAGQLSDWIFLNRNLDRILTRDYSGRKFKYDEDIKTFQDLIDFQLIYTSVGSYVSSLLIVGKNGIDLRAGIDGALVNRTEIRKTEWFIKGLAQKGKKTWYGIIANPAVINNEDYILPLARPIIHSSVNREIGWNMIGFKTALISDLLKNLEIGKDETLLVIDTRGFCISHNDHRHIGQDLSAINYIRTILKQKTSGHFGAKIDDVSRVVVFEKSKLTGWSIVKILSSVELNRQKRIHFNIMIIILFSSFIFTSFLTVYLSTNLTKPFTKLLQQTKAIAAGKFDPDPSIEGEDELGILGRGFNEMSANIQNLLTRIIRDEQEKRRLELEVLQNQVNPHFLYNTLNSLKLMATMQKAEGIKEMVTALGRLIKNLSKNTSEKITLEEEISLLNDYVYIQNIRYKGKIKLEYNLEHENYRKYRIIKFTLQPIVENAIFHGIEPKKDAGRIIITISKERDHLLICIEDDGVGMTPAQIESVLSNPPAEMTRGLSGIGVKNVDERIKMTYGPEYGLAIESVAGEYTRVYLKIPGEL